MHLLRLIALKSLKKNKERKLKEKQDRKVVDTKQVATKVPAIDRKHLHNYRVVQRNLVYIIGIPGTIASEETLRKAEYFGQYGKITKVVVHRNHTSSHATVSAYITFAFKEDAKAAIQALEGFWLDGHQIRASFGTTKYCNNFIRGVPCNNPECVYLHELGEDEDRFTKEEIQAGYSKLMQQPGRDQIVVTGAGGPSGTGKRPTGELVLPPPVFVQDIAVAEKKKAALASPKLTSSASSDNIPAIEEISPAANPQAIQPIQGSDVNEEKIAESKTSVPSVQDVKVNGSLNPNSANNQKETSKNSVSQNEIGKDAKGNSPSDSKSLVQGVNSSQENKGTEEKSVIQITSEDKPDKIDQTKNTKKESSTGVSTHQTNNNPSSGSNSLVSPNSFNGLGNCAVFPVPVSSLTVSIWSNLLKSTSDDLKINPYALIALPVTELFELTIPPVDAACMSVWPKPLSYYSQGVGVNGITHAPAGQHTYYRSTGFQENTPESSSNASTQNSQLQQPQPQHPQQHQQQQRPNSTSSSSPARFYTQQTTQNNTYTHSYSGNTPTPQQPSISSLQQMFPTVNMNYGGGPVPVLIASSKPPNSSYHNLNDGSLR